VNRCRLALAFASLLVSLGDARADVYDDAWKRGNEAYFQGDYRGALTAYEEIDRQGVVAADLYYNMGVAYHRLGENGRSAWSFERALALRHDDEDARFNLDQVRKILARQASDRLEGAERDPVWIRIVTSLAPSTEIWMFLVFYGLTFLILLWRLRQPSESRAPYTAGAALSGVAALMMAALLMGRLALDRIPFGIVLPDAVAVKEGADLNYRTAFDIHAGLRVRLLEQEASWLRIRLANGLEGWVRQQDVGRL
jgi:tetratricopeptide (TPR) repeat protein